MPSWARIHAVDANAPVSDVHTLNCYVSAALAAARVESILFGGFASPALILAATGIFAVMACSVAQRTRDIAVRVALGAGQTNITGMVLGQAIALAAGGMVIGGALTRLLTSFLFGVEPNDPLTYCVICFLVAAVAAAAILIPARRAAQVDPLVALRHE